MFYAILEFDKSNVSGLSSHEKVKYIIIIGQFIVSAELKNLFFKLSRLLAYSPY